MAAFLVLPVLAESSLVKSFLQNNNLQSPYAKVGLGDEASLDSLYSSEICGNLLVFLHNFYSFHRGLRVSFPN